MESAINRQRVLLDHLRPPSSSDHNYEAALSASICFAGDTSGYQSTSAYGDDAVIVAAFRTALCKAKHGGFKDTYADDLLAPVLKLAKVQRQALVLEAYLERRSIALPEGYLLYKVIAPNPKFHCLNSEQLPTEVITHDQWLQMKAESRNLLTRWTKGACKGGKKEVQESVEQQFNLALKTAPLWDRLEFRGNKHLLGEFLEFKGKNEGTQALECIKNEKMAMVFTYGTLKKGFWNHTLMQELMASMDAVFVGSCRTVERYPLVCGPYRVPFLLNMPGAGEKVLGELYAVSNKGLARVDELEGISKGHYERLPIRLELAEGGPTVDAEAYFGHTSYAEEMWRRSGERGYTIYSEKEARGYVNRKDRPRNLTFLDHIRIFLSSPAV